ncbi:SET and MYND domain-containing protein 4-like [Palaemon carinicauda]|uniref:SET and MYND domain-containing protein 4-like n=1 Tax=Palaemon carinicauda TaxID=392227 RepID=UPI0035B5E40D
MMAHNDVNKIDDFDIYMKKGGTNNVDDMLNYISKMGSPELEEPSPAKSESRAARFMVEGADYYMGKYFEQALESFNWSIMEALHPVLEDSPVAQEESTNPQEEEDLFSVPPVRPSKYGGADKGEIRALTRAFACRSLILFDLQLYELSLREVELFFEYACDEEDLSVMQARKAEIIKKLKDIKERDCLDADSANQNKDSHGDHSHSSEPSLQTLRPVDVSLRNEILESFERVEIPKVAECNQSTPALSSALRVSNIEGKGRGIIATRDISPGEIVAVDRAFSAFTQNYDHLPLTCATCLRVSMLPLPCPGCSQVVFCSKSCRDRGLSEDHWLECKIQPQIKEKAFKVTMGACKLLKTFNHAQIDKLTKELRAEEESSSGPDRIKGFSPGGTYSSESYRSFHHLYYDMENRTPKNLFGICKGALRVAKMVTVSGRYFVDDGGKAVTPKMEEFLNLCRTIVVNVEIMLKNSFECGWPDGVKYSGVFPTASLFNHSCYPSVGYKEYGRHMVLFSKLPIKAGEEVTIGYTEPFYYSDRDERRDNLKSYGFTCTCRACKENWYLYQSLPFLELKCTLCHHGTVGAQLVCGDCLNLQKLNEPDGVLEREESEIKSTLELIRNNIVSLEWRKPDKNELDLVSLSKKIELLHKHVAGPCKALMILMNVIDAWI